MTSGYSTDAERFLGEIVGYRRLAQAFESGSLERILMERGLPETIKSRILGVLGETILGTMEARVLHPQETVDGSEAIKIPRIVTVEEAMQYHGDTISTDSDLDQGELETTAAYDAAIPTETTASQRYHRYLVDRKLIPRRLREAVTHVIGDSDRMFTRRNRFLERVTGVGARGAFTEDYLRELMSKAGFAQDTYMLSRNVTEGKPGYSRGKEEIVRLAGTGYCLIFRPFGPISSLDADIEIRPPGTAIYLDARGIRKEIATINKSVATFRSLTRAKEREME